MSLLHILSLLFNLRIYSVLTAFCSGFQFFSLKVKNPTKPIAPGLCVPAIVEFETSEAKEIRDRLVVTVDGDVVEIPLIALVSLEYAILSSLVFQQYD